MGCSEARRPCCSAPQMLILRNAIVTSQPWNRLAGGHARCCAVYLGHAMILWISCYLSAGTQLCPPPAVAFLWNVCHMYVLEVSRPFKSHAGPLSRIGLTDSHPQDEKSLVCSRPLGCIIVRQWQVMISSFTNGIRSCVHFNEKTEHEGTQRLPNLKSLVFLISLWPLCFRRTTCPMLEIPLLLHDTHLNFHLGTLSLRRCSQT